MTPRVMGKGDSEPLELRVGAMRIISELVATIAGGAPTHRPEDEHSRGGSLSARWKRASVGGSELGP